MWVGTFHQLFKKSTANGREIVISAKSPKLRTRFGILKIQIDGQKRRRNARRRSRLEKEVIKQQLAYMGNNYVKDFYERFDNVFNPQQKSIRFVNIQYKNRTFFIHHHTVDHHKLKLTTSDPLIRSFYNAIGLFGTGEQIESIILQKFPKAVVIYLDGVLKHDETQRNFVVFTKWKVQQSKYKIQLFELSLNIDGPDVDEYTIIIECLQNNGLMRAELPVWAFKQL